jgi:hypothetical protein
MQCDFFQKFLKPHFTQIRTVRKGGTLAVNEVMRIVEFKVVACP